MFQFLRILSCVLAIGAGLCAPLPVAGEGAAADPAAEDFPIRRIILLSCDTLSAQEVGTWGGDLENSATLDSLAEWGVRFEHCLTPIGWTLPAHMSMLTGLSPGAHGVGSDRPLAKRIPYLPRILANHGFFCNAFVTQNGWMSPTFGFDRGFTIYQSLDRKQAPRFWGQGWLRNFHRDEKGEPRPIFLMLHYMDVHSTKPSLDYLLPYWPQDPIALHYFEVPDPPPDAKLKPGGEQWDIPAYDGEILRHAYSACIWEWDRRHLGSLATLLRRLDLEFDTLLIVTADHGEEFGQHGSWEHDSPHAGVRRVPLLMCCPALLPLGKVIDEPVSLQDLAPTILDLAGLPPLPQAQGRSLRPLMAGDGTAFPRRDFLIDGIRRGEELLDSALVAWEDGTWWSLVATTDTTAGAGRPTRAGDILGLYDLDRDPRETTNLLAERPDLARRLLLRLDEAFARDAVAARAVAGDAPDTRIEISDETRRNLRSLGY